MSTPTLERLKVRHSAAITDLKIRALDTSLPEDARKLACESLSFIDDKSCAKPAAR